MTKQDFNTKLSELIGNDFAFLPDTGRWERQNQNHIERIGISYNEYVGSYYVKGITVAVLFPQIENILNPLLKKYQVLKRLDDSTIHKVLTEIHGVNYQSFNTEIVDALSFGIVASELSKLIRNGALPFLQTYNSLEMVASLLADKEAEEIVPFIQGPVLLPKTVLILKEVNHPAFKEKKAEFYKLLKAYSEKKDSYKPYLKVFEELFQNETGQKYF